MVELRAALQRHPHPLSEGEEEVERKRGYEHPVSDGTAMRRARSRTADRKPHSDSNSGSSSSSSGRDTAREGDAEYDLEAKPRGDPSSRAAHEVERALRAEIDSLWGQLSAEKESHMSSRRELSDAYAKLDAASSARSSAATVNTAAAAAADATTAAQSSRLLPQQLEELRGLREKCTDQSEQIEVLVSELAKVREELAHQRKLCAELRRSSVDHDRAREELQHMQKKSVVALQLSFMPFPVRY